VIGLLCDESGRPLSIEVFPGNTQDPKTVAYPQGINPRSKRSQRDLAAMMLPL